MKKEIVFLGGARTPMGEYGGVLRDFTANELGAMAAKAALERVHITPDQIDHTVMGNAMQTSADAIYGARHVALKAGVPIDRPALTVNRLCGSGIQSIVSGAQMIQLDEAKRLDPRSAGPRVLLAQIYAKRNLPSLARWELNKVLNLDPSHRQATEELRRLDNPKSSSARL